MFRIISIALVWLALAFPCQAQMTTLGAGGTAKAGLPGPPTFTFNVGGNAVQIAPSGNTITFNTLAIGSAFSTRFVAIMVLQYSANAMSSATINGSSSGVTVTNIGSNSEVTVDLVTATVSSGTTLNLVATYSAAPSSFNFASAYTSDTTTMSSTTPINYGLTQTTSATSMTKTFNVTGAGTAIIVGFGGFGISNGSQAFTTPNDPGVTNDWGTDHATMAAHANNFGPNASTRVSASWTTTGNGNMAAVGFR